jgi:hypothetical protein
LFRFPKRRYESGCPHPLKGSLARVITVETFITKHGVLKKLNRVEGLNIVEKLNIISIYKNNKPDWCSAFPREYRIRSRLRKSKAGYSA